MLKNIVEKYNCDYTQKRISQDDIPIYEQELGMSFGPQLKEYLLDYGYLGYSYVMLFGINSFRKSNSDMITTTLTLREEFEDLDNLAVIESISEHEFYLIDSNDMIHNINEATMEFTSLGIDFCQYLEKHFSEIK